MVEGIVVDAPQFYPHGCVICQSATGPLVDTSVELVGGSRVYLCASCVRLAGIKLELIDGVESDKKRSAVTRLSVAEKQLTATQERLKKQSTAFEEQVRMVAELKSALEQSNGRVSQLEQAITDRARGDLALVGG